MDASNNSLRRRRRAWWGPAALAVTAALALGGCQGDNAAVDRKPQLVESPTALTDPDAELIPRSVLLRFDDFTSGQQVDEIVNTGELPVAGKVITANGGHLISTKGPLGQGIQLPAFSRSDPQLAMIGLFNTGDVFAGTDDPLSPGERDFGFGADFMIDETTTGSDVDNGDNLIARGLFEGAAQYKIQVDDGYLSCRVAGLEGEVLVKAHQKVQPGQWYRARCTRTGDTVRLVVAELEGAQDQDWVVMEDSGPIGSVQMAQSVPLSVGGKLSGTGTIFPTSTDQFNGRIDRVVYRLHD